MKPRHPEDVSMSLTFRPLHRDFAAEVSFVDLRLLRDETTLNEIRSGLDRFAVLVWRDQLFTDREQLDFASRFDGELHSKTGMAALQENRSGHEALTDISNLDDQGEIVAADDRRRLYSLANRLWHTDASFQDPPGRYSMLHARVVPPVSADTQYVDTRAAYDALPDEMKHRLESLLVHHSIAYSRRTLGFEFSVEEADQLRGAVHPLVRTLPGSGRRSLYLASHGSRVIDWPVPEGRLLLRDLIERATQAELIYTHAWRPRDFLIWDNRATMHRGVAFDDTRYRRELRRVTSLDLPHVVPDLSSH
jgi:alpha-ketoglutarate-dependent 2,4-dichlorophenoxyacetate dioxygenase